MYSAVYFNRRTSNIHIWEYNEDGQKLHKTISAPLYFYIKDTNGEYTSIYGDKLKRVDCDTFSKFQEKVSSYKEMGYKLFESDITPETKFIVNQYVGKELKIPKNLDIFFFDIEVHSEEGFPFPEEAKYPIVIITLWSTRHNKFFIFSKKEFDTSFLKEDFECVIEDNEELLLKKFIKFISTCNADILSGWNSNGFDIPYIVNRVNNILGEKYVQKLSPISKVNERDFSISEGKTRKVYDIVGISCIDYLEVYKNYNFSERESYKLGYIAKTDIGETKIEYEGSISDLYNNNWQKYVEYNIQDTRLLFKLENKLGYMKMLINFCYGCRVPFEHYDRTTKVLDGAFYSELLQSGVILPDIDKDLKNTKYPGGYVKDPLRGFHNWVISFDATSLYPSIMMNWNISPETKKGVINKAYIESMHKALMKVSYKEYEVTIIGMKEMIGIDEWTGSIGELYKLITEVKKGKVTLKKSINENGGVHGLFNDYAMKNINKCIDGKEFQNISFYYNDDIVTVESFVAMIKENNLCLSQNGVCYSQDTKGVIPTFVEKWFKERNLYKKKEKEAKKLLSECSDPNEISKLEELKKTCHLNQLNRKILINSVYGYLGTVYSRFYDFDNCVAVCINGQQIIKTVGKYVDYYFRKKYNINDSVIYSDTDSVYIGLEKLINKKYPNLTYITEEQSKEIIKDYISCLDSDEKYTNDKDGNICLEKEIVSVIETSMNKFTKVNCNCKENRISFKREAIARSSMFLERKRYVGWVLNNENVNMSELKTTGVDIVRSNTPKVIQKLLSEIVFGILKNVDKNKIDTMVSKARDSFMSASIEDISKPMGVKTYDKYLDQMIDGNFKSVPNQVKAAYHYNKFLIDNPKIAQLYEQIFEGDKMKIIKMKVDSSWRSDVFGFKDKWIKESGLEYLVDRDAQFEAVFINPVNTFYEIMGWSLPNVKYQLISDLFD